MARNNLSAKCSECGRKVSNASAYFVTDKRASFEGPFGRVRGHWIFGRDCAEDLIGKGLLTLDPEKGLLNTGWKEVA